MNALRPRGVWRAGAASAKAKSAQSALRLAWIGIGAAASVALSVRISKFVALAANVGHEVQLEGAIRLCRACRNSTWAIAKRTCQAQLRNIACQRGCKRSAPFATSPRNRRAKPKSKRHKGVVIHSLHMARRSIMGIRLSTKRANFHGQPVNTTWCLRKTQLAAVIVSSRMAAMIDAWARRSSSVTKLPLQPTARANKTSLELPQLVKNELKY